MLFGGPLLWSACVERRASKQQLVALEALSFSFSAARARTKLAISQRLAWGVGRLLKAVYVLQRSQQRRQCLWKSALGFLGDGFSQISGVFHAALCASAKAGERWHRPNPGTKTTKPCMRGGPGPL